MDPGFYSSWLYSVWVNWGNWVLGMALFPIKKNIINKELIANHESGHSCREY